MIQHQDSSSNTSSERWLTIPNVLCLLRFVGAWGLIVGAVLTRPTFVVGLFFFLTATDWVDGKLAVLLNQRSKIGPKLDTIADVTMYGCLLVAIVMLYGEVLKGEAVLIGLALFSYTGSCAYSWRKFGVIPSYHTRVAKTCWFLVLIAVIALFIDWSVWPLRLAAVAITFANVEAMLITRHLNEPRSDVRWLTTRSSQPKRRSK